jgi:hypothetical protein
LLPENPESSKAFTAVLQVNQVFNPQKLEELQQFNLTAEELEACPRIIVALMILLEKIERSTVQMPRMCGILPGGRVRIVWCDNLHLSPILGNAINFLHGPED